MSKLNLQTQQIESDYILEKENVVSAIIGNYGNNVVYFIRDGVKRILPVANPDTGLPTEQFEFFFGGDSFDLKIEFKFTITPETVPIRNTGKIIIDFATLNNNCQ